jgi:hypothetical protein
LKVADGVLRTLRDHPAWDDRLGTCQAARWNRPHISEVCHRQAKHGLIERDDSHGDIVIMMSGLAPPRGPAAAETVWQVNLQSRVAAHLAGAGSSIIRVDDTPQGESGVGIAAGDQCFAGALASLIRAEPGFRLGRAAPGMPRYRALFQQAGWTSERLDITAFLVTAEGPVEIWEREN